MDADKVEFELAQKPLKPQSDEKQNGVIEHEPVNYLDLYKFATSSDKALIVVAIILSAVSAACLGICSHQVGFLTGAIVDYLHEMNDSKVVVELEEKLLEKSTRFFAISMVAGFVILIATFGATVIFSYTALRQTRTIKLKFLSSLLNQDISWFDLNQTGDFATRITDDLRRIEEGIGYKVASLLFVTFSAFANVALALSMNWKLTLICMSLIPIQFGLVFLVGWASSKLSKNELDAYADAGTVAEETLNAIRTVYAFEGQNKEHDRYYDLLKVASKNNVKRAIFNGVGNGVSWFFGYACLGFTLWVGIKFILDDRDLPEDLRECDASKVITIVFSMINGLWFFLMLAPPIIQMFSGAKAGASKIFAVINSKGSINTCKLEGISLSDVKGDIEFRDVYFNYPSRETVDVLRGLSFKVRAGETVALVGASGCGKSTCVQLVQRFYDAHEGCVLIDGVDVTKFNLSWLRSRIGIVEQEPVLFETTIAENIKIGCKNVSGADVIDAAQQANAHDFIRSFPDGYDTIVGERGTQLSGGQKQRIAIARALVRKPSILLLDEATSSLDVQNEMLVQNAIDKISHGCTAVIVAHRLSTVRRADKIIVIVNGRMVEEGSHQVLMQMQGEYYKLVTSQITSTDDDNDSTKEIERSIGDIKNCLEVRAEHKTTETNSATSSLLQVLKLGAPELWTTLFGSTNAVAAAICFCLISVLYGNLVGVLQNGDLDYVMDNRNNLGLYFCYVSTASAVVSVLQFYALGVSGEKLILRIRSRMFKTILSQEISWFDKKENSVGALGVTLSSDAAMVQQATSQCFGFLLYMLTVFVLALACAFYFEWHVTLATLTLYPALFFSIALEQKIISENSNKLHETLQNTTKIAVEAISGIRTVASLGCENVFLQKYTDKLRYHEGKVKKTIIFRGLVQGIAYNIIAFCYAVGLYYGAILVVRKQADFVNMFIAVDVLGATSWALAHSATFLIDFEKGYKAAQRIVVLLNSKIRSYSKTKTDANNDITYENVHFSYPERSAVPILKGLNLSVLQGKIVALVGPSGCGKSTVIQLLQRFYDPDAGNITIGKDDIKNLGLSNLRFNLGVVSQEPNLFSKTIRENIAYGDNSKIITYQEIVDAATKANIHGFVASLPLGYDTKLGERGMQLSGGQKQRIAIARVLIRNPKILLLDEATSALDAESEKIVQQTLDDAKTGRTCIIIAHRLSTIEDADLICVLHNGKVAEIGTHHQLLNLKRIYYQLYNIH